MDKFKLVVMIRTIVAIATMFSALNSAYLQVSYIGMHDWVDVTWTGFIIVLSLIALYVGYVFTQIEVVDNT